MHQFSQALIVDLRREDRERLRRIVEKAFPGIAVHSAGDPVSARSLLQRHAYQLVLVEAGNTMDEACELIALAHDGRMPAHVVAIAEDCNEQRLAAALRAGAEGYLVKGEESEELVLRLRGLARGNPPLSPLAARQLLKTCMRTVPMPTAASELTCKELEVLTVLARGVKLRQAADDLGVSYNTVATHVKRLYSKLNVSTRAEATLAATRIGLVC
ncbi:DNA-binding response regulator [Solimonas sp. K1W22B-7]|uniref:helix-turn-helix transcriptional regulator n=1 Tax=Solimonas sp. K1W22B-7 TaxID=2303331 RepID=UPI000E32DC10|nr:response regulator transcription factor [Solimonas sp. K1W22B-7]AXQ31354.1 DNA-binding response regulator [Solimonas sp. K1W22B-7]